MRNLSRREKFVALAAAAVVLLWMLDSVVLSPAWSRYRADSARAISIQQELFDARQRIRHADNLRKQWNDRLASGLSLPTSQAEGKMLEAVEAWAGESGLVNVSMRPDRMDAKEGLRVIRCRVSAEGPMSALVRMCWRMENAAMPLRIENLRLSCPDSKADRLALQFDISTACLDEAAKGEPQP